MVMPDEDEDGEPEGEGWELDPNDPSHPDFDLSETGYSGVEPEKSPWRPSRALIMAVTVLLLVAMLWPACRQLFP
jgi:hypothetical protein